MLRSQKFIEKVKAKKFFLFKNISYKMKKKRNTANIFDEFIYYGDEWRPPNKRQPESAHTSGHIPLQLIIIVIVIIRSSTSL